MKLTVINCRFLTQKISGVQRFAFELCSMLNKLNDNFVFVCPNDDLQIEPDFKIVRIGKNKGHFWEQFDLLLYLKKKNNPLLINFTGVGPILYSNKIVTIHDLSFLFNPNWFSKKYYLYYKIMTKLTVKTSRKILTVSNFSKKEIIRLLKIDKNKISVIYNAVSWEPENELIQKNKEKYILTVSSIEPRKNLAKLIRGFLKSNLKDYKLVIVGATNKVFSEVNIEDNEKIIFTGYVSDKELLNLYKKASLFVYIPFYEGFGIPPLEAMSQGCPVITSNTSSLPEVCGNAAYFVNPEDEQEVANIINKIIKNTDIQKELISNGFNNLKKYSWYKSASELIKIIYNIN